MIDDLGAVVGSPDRVEQRRLENTTGQTGRGIMFQRVAGGASETMGGVISWDAYTSLGSLANDG